MKNDLLKISSKNKDSLTGLYRREVIFEYMDNLINKSIPFSFAILDIDNFKSINDTYGHMVGDLTLEIVAKHLEKLVSNVGVIGRYGGDEFIFVFPNIVEYQDEWQQLLVILKSSNDIKIGDYNINITFTVGASKYPLDSTNIDNLFSLADKALYRGKVKGRNCFIIYLEEKHGDIRLQTIREKVYNPINLHSKIINTLSKKDNIKKNIKSIIDFFGAYLLIDHICIEKNNKLLYEYYQPISKNKELKIYGAKNIKKVINDDGFFVSNVTLNDKNDNKIYKEFIEQKVYACVLCKLQYKDKSFGYLRCDMTNVNTGRIWQAEDLVIIRSLAIQISMALYINYLETKNNKGSK